MPRFAANLSTLFTDAPLLARFERAARAGFVSVEMQFPYDQPAALLREQLLAHGLAMVLHNMPPGNAAAGERGIACHPGREDEFRAGVALAIDYARTLSVPRLHCMAGVAPPGVDDDALLRRTFIANLRVAAAACKAAGIQLLIEPINRHDVSGYWLNSTALALSVLDELCADNAALQYDVYHAQRNEGELAATMTRLLPRIGHIQVADNPGRHEPGSGEIHYPFLFRHLARIGYAGFIGCEYVPAGATEAGLAWLRHARSCWA